MSGGRTINFMVTGFINLIRRPKDLHLMLSQVFKINRIFQKIGPALWHVKIFKSSCDCTLIDYNKLHYKTIKTFNNMSSEIGLPLKEVLEKLIKIAPLSLAERWDNVGLLVEPSVPKNIKKIFLTNDLTEKVVDEAIVSQADFIISYHPPIFVPLKSLTSRTWKERVIVRCIENKIAVFSPHTCWDSIHGGVNDWMASVFGQENNVVPLTHATQYGMHTHMVEVAFPNSPVGNSTANEFQKQLRQYIDGCGEEPTCDLRDLFVKEMKMSIPCTASALPKVVNIFHKVKSGSGEEHLRVAKYDEVPIPLCGTGRLCTLKCPLPVSKVIELVKAHINRPHVRLALVPGKDMNSTVASIAICVGSGTSVLRGVKADLYLTGEMLHHDVLDAVHNGSHVILCNHSDSERGFLSTLASRLNGEYEGAVDIMISEEDRDPLNTV